jgi:hypothetical protein
VAAAFKFDGWQKEYLEALGERDLVQLPNRVMTAESAIFNRMQELNFRDGNGDSALPQYAMERAALEHASEGLLLLKCDKLNWPSWETPK